MRLPILLATLLATACAPATPAIEAADAWARATAPGQGAAVYVSIANRGGTPDRLIGVATPRAGMAMLHSAESSGGIARMRPAGILDIAAGGTLELAPGGTHIMLGGLDRPLAAGETFPLTLTFEKAGATRVTVAVVAAGER